MINNYIYLLHHKLDRSNIKFLFMLVLVSPLSIITLCDSTNSILICILAIITFTFPIGLSRFLYITGSLQFNKNIYGRLPQVGDVYIVSKQMICPDHLLHNGFKIKSGTELKVSSLLPENTAHKTGYFFECKVSGVTKVINFIEFSKYLKHKSDLRNDKLHKILGRKFGL